MKPQSTITASGGTNEYSSAGYLVVVMVIRTYLKIADRARSAINVG
jgi:hypothetical protein